MNAVSAEEKSLVAATVTVPAHPEYSWSGLYRAIVSLPAFLCQREHAGFQERVVFFESTHGQECETLEKVLAAAWCCDTTGWVANGAAYNINSATQWFRESAMGEGDARLFECTWSALGIEHHCREDVDFFVTPRRKARLEAALRSTEAIAKAQRRHGASAVKVTLQRIPARLA